MTTFPIAAITDEFSLDLDTALDAMAKIGMTGAELRLIGDRNMIDLSDAEAIHDPGEWGEHLHVVQVRPGGLEITRAKAEPIGTGGSLLLRGGKLAGDLEPAALRQAWPGTAGTSDEEIDEVPGAGLHLRDFQFPAVRDHLPPGEDATAAEPRRGIRCGSDDELQVGVGGIVAGADRDGPSEGVGTIVNENRGTLGRPRFPRGSHGSIDRGERVLRRARRLVIARRRNVKFRWRCRGETSEEEEQGGAQHDAAYESLSRAFAFEF